MSSDYFLRHVSLTVLELLFKFDSLATLFTLMIVIFTLRVSCGFSARLNPVKLTEAPGVFNNFEGSTTFNI